MFPILFQNGPFVITSFGVFLTLGFISFLISLQWYGPSRDLSLSFFVKHILSLFLATILGSKILFWLCEFSLLSGSLTAYIVREDYYGIFRLLCNSEEFYLAGGLIAFLGLFYFYAKKHKESFLSWLDVLVPSFLTGMFFGYIGAFLGGYYVGKEAESFLGLLFTGDPKYSFASQLYTVPIHPIQIYSLVATLLIFIVLRILLKRISVPGAVGVLGMTLFALQSFVIEFFRGNDNMFRFGFFTLNQYIALTTIIIGCYIFLKKLPKVDLSSAHPQHDVDLAAHT